ncbi:unnamed protein product [Mucor hiemalis]
MRISSAIFTLFGATIFTVTEVLASLTHQQISNTVSHFNHLNPTRSIMQIQRGDLQPVAYVQTSFIQQKAKKSNRLNNIRSKKGRKNKSRPSKNRSLRNNRHEKKKSKKKSRYSKRDYATTLQYLKAAMDSYRKDSVTPPPVQLMQLEQQFPPPPTEEVPPVAATQDFEFVNPPLPDLTAAEPTPELGNEISESAPMPAAADIEEDDSFDPEEDPDDVDDPPVVNGVAVQREE